MNQDREQRHLRGLAHLAAAVAHKMNNDLAGITCNLSMILADLDDGEQPSDMPELISDALLAAQHAANLLQNAFGLFRLDDSECEVLDVGETLGLVVGSTVQQQQLELDVEVPDTSDALRVRSTPERIQRMVAPLLINAAQSRQEPRVRAVVETGLSDVPQGGALDELESEPFIMIRVTDDGPGVPAELGQKAFEPFVTTKERGRGLGLAITLALARAHGGSVGLRAAPGGGSEFTIWLPPQS